MAGTLSHDDVDRLLANPSAKSRAATAAKVAAGFDRGELSASERRLAEDILRSLARDAEVSVREALAAHLKGNPDLPRDVAQRLAADVDSVALPLLQFSDVLAEQDLVAIVLEGRRNRQLAIAGRAHVPESVSDALIDNGDETVVARLIDNEGAIIAEPAYERALSIHGRAGSVGDSLARRSDLPASVAARMIAAVAEQLQDYLIRRASLSPDAATDLILQARERALVDLVGTRTIGDEAELERLVDQLSRAGRLSPWLVLRTLCFGDLTFFEASLARLARVSLANARILIHDEGQLGLTSICRRAGLPERLLPAFRTALLVRLETDYDGSGNDRRRFVERMLERLLTVGEDAATLEPADREFLARKLTQMAA
ncbi:MAG: DUF2336 domain-containing protein [Tistlia sp.]|uniref:DUF2336 domain-containing protein n=1 Tax=Tistlia sp. TaxID=3057121 RepID=UPI0034A25AD8